MPRFFVDPADVGEGEIIIRDKDAYHIDSAFSCGLGTLEV